MTNKTKMSAVSLRCSSCLNTSIEGTWVHNEFICNRCLPMGYGLKPVSPEDIKWVTMQAMFKGLSAEVELLRTQVEDLLQKKSNG